MALTATARGTGTHNTSASSFNASPTSNCTAGKVLVLMVAADNSSSGGSTADFNATLTDSLGNTWTRRTQQVFDNGAASAGVQYGIYTTDQAAGTVQTSTTVPVAFGSSPTAKTYVFWELSGSTGTPSYWGADGGVGATTASPTITSSSGLTSGWAVIGFLAGEAGTTQSVTAADTDTTNGNWSTGQYAEIGSTTSGSVAYSQVKVISGTTAQTWNPTFGLSMDCLNVLAYFEEVANNNTALPTALSLVTTYGTPVIGQSAIPSAALALVWTGATPTVTQGFKVLPTALAMTWAGSTPTVTVGANNTAQPTALALTWTGSTPVVTQPVNPTVLALTWSGATPSVTVGQQAQPTALALAWTGAVPVIGSSARPTALSLVTSYGTPVIGKDARPTALALAWTGATPTVTATAHNISLPTALALAWTGSIPTVAVTSDGAQVSLPTALALAWTGAVPAVTQTQGTAGVNQQMFEGSGLSADERKRASALRNRNQNAVLRQTIQEDDQRKHERLALILGALYSASGE